MRKSPARARGTAAGRKLIASLNEAADAAERGELLGPPGSIVRRFDAEPGVYEPDEIRRLRENFAVTQGDFARILGVSTAQVQSLEIGRREPSRLVRRMLDSLNSNRPKHPRAINSPAVLRVIKHLLKYARVHAGGDVARLADRVIDVIGSTRTPIQPNRVLTRPSGPAGYVVKRDGSGSISIKPANSGDSTTVRRDTPSTSHGSENLSPGQAGRRARRQ